MQLQSWTIFNSLGSDFIHFLWYNLLNMNVVKNAFIQVYTYVNKFSFLLHIFL